MSLFKNIPESSLRVNKNDPNELLGSTSAHSFFLDDQDWPTAEHYYQAMKFDDADYREKIRNAESAQAAIKLGHRLLKRKRSDFKKVRKTLMTRAMYTKCRTYPIISKTLLETGEDYIAESSFSDYFWGCGRDGRGENQFGKILMSVRAKLLEETRQDNTD